jgi:branched-chain amino acid aminotransferase
MSDLQVFLNGRLVPASQASVGVFDAGLLHGASVFTTMLAHKGKVFRMGRHLRRLLDTCQSLGLLSGLAEDELASAVGEVLRANDLAEARMRITLTPGSVREDGAGPTTLITAEPLQEYPRAWYEKGVSVVVSSYRQMPGDPAYGRKTGNYLSRMLARREAAQKGVEEALWYTPDNHLAEACFCNVFLVLEKSAAGAGTTDVGTTGVSPVEHSACPDPDGRDARRTQDASATGTFTVHTPPLDTPVLPGIVREAVIELCGSLGVACDDRTPLTVRHMLAAREMFLTSSTAGLRPVVRVERHAVGDERPGPLTSRLMQAYRELLDRECA